MNRSLGSILGAAAISTVLSALPSHLISAAEGSVDYSTIWMQFGQAAQRFCPSHHIDDFSDGQYDEVLEDFLSRYPKKFRTHVNQIVDYPKTCAQETAGFTCEFSAHLAAFQKLGLFEKFIRHSCSHWRCREASLCDKMK